MEEVEIYTEFINLGQLLKYLGIIYNGSDAKNYLDTNNVLVNNELENRRGRKLYPGFIVKIGQDCYKITKNGD